MAFNFLFFWLLFPFYTVPLTSFRTEKSCKNEFLSINSLYNKINATISSELKTQWKERINSLYFKGNNSWWKFHVHFLLSFICIHFSCSQITAFCRRKRLNRSCKIKVCSICFALSLLLVVGLNIFFLALFFHFPILLLLYIFRFYHLSNLFRNQAIQVYNQCYFPFWICLSNWEATSQQTKA